MISLRRNLACLGKGKDGGREKEGKEEEEMSLEVEAKVEVTDKSKRCCQEEGREMSCSGRTLVHTAWDLFYSSKRLFPTASACRVPVWFLSQNQRLTTAYKHSEEKSGEVSISHLPRVILFSAFGFPLWVFLFSDTVSCSLGWP